MVVDSDSKDAAWRDVRDRGNAARAGGGARARPFRRTTDALCARPSLRDQGEEHEEDVDEDEEEDDEEEGEEEEDDDDEDLEEEEEEEEEEEDGTWTQSSRLAPGAPRPPAAYALTPACAARVHTEYDEYDEVRLMRWPGESV